METIDLTPTWSQVLLVYLEVYANSESAEGRKTALNELKRMALIADQRVKDLKSQNPQSITVAFGEQLTKIIANGDDPEEYADQGAGYMVTHDFKTEAETAAYRQALEDHSGWLESYELDQEEVKKYCEVQYENHYKCPYDGAEWADVWDCACNDKCPQCNAEIEPFKSEKL